MLSEHVWHKHVYGRILRTCPRVPSREPDENGGMIENKSAQMFNYFGNQPIARLEGKTVALKYDDPCASIYIVPEDRSNDIVPYMVNEERMAFNQANAAMTVAWTILCALQQAFLYYLFFVGPVVAALWPISVPAIAWCLSDLDRRHSQRLHVEFVLEHHNLTNGNLPRS